ncbi:putative protein binding protein [Tripterygium wilfordii]|uniref:Sister chromatid cohesion protein DCC1 n=1 Tax=Tripterygium wilfordii TaxID=458696 RepID=A0A7J7CFB3_TRIWF|nr:sister chromatid cohesion protein DCC1 [Tripterygium wilfordii]XP_038681420.1 sister chromatid cohesion protein DCC1 [Tripterygium wilfordii]XP_038681421.1 sister chromatid cohesion protein DCC1 [Tripterygium wilfordii]XP_038681422.1 sister chromatid cohesion protein DCC1 [Tripterygium wilfordii]XP_038681423.1 sister chromatid cohesion protein DCC1 [Tripterygium wilfordii]KAF5732823.1 putative protein binding protein [Tripterygium wilfordii]
MPKYGGGEAVLNMQPNSSISVAYHPQFGPHDDLILLELDEKLLQDVLQQKVIIRGQPDEDAVLCTQLKTYGIKFVGTSNSVFLVPPSDQALSFDDLEDCDGKDNDFKVVASVIKVAAGSMELTEVAPRLEKLKLLISENPYSSDEMEDLEDIENTKKGLYKWDDLVDRVQASDNELRTGLHALSAVEINGYWRIVDEKYMDNTLRMLLHNSILNDWSLDLLHEDEVVNVMISDGFPHELVLHCLNVFCSKMDGGEGRIRSWRLNDRRVCVHFARQILREGKMKMETFMAEWKQKIPDGMQASFDMLEGEVLTERLGVETWVRPFSLSSLPSTPAQRFSALFSERPKWEEKDLQPYIRDLKVPGLSSEALLLKYTRRTQPTVDAEPVFSAR